MDSRRRQRRDVDQRLRPQRLPSGLQALGLLDLPLIAHQRVGLGDREMDEQRGDLVPEFQMLARGTDVHRHHRPQALVRERLTAAREQVAEAARGNARAPRR